MKNNSLSQSRRNSLAAFTKAVRADLVGFLHRRLGDAPLAEELAQEALLNFAAGSYDPSVHNARPLLFGIAKNLLFDCLKKRRREQALGLMAFEDAEKIMAATPAESPAPDAIVLSQEELAVVTGVIEKLPKRARQAFTLSRMYGLTHAQIAEELSISKSMVEKHIMEATARFLVAMRKIPEVNRE